MRDPSSHLAENLKSLRAERGWSLSQCASETGVSKAMLGQIERGESSPTIATLWKIAGGFNLSLSSLLGEAGDVRPEDIFTIRDAKSLRKPIGNDGMLTATLFPYDPKSGFEFFELTFPPEYERVSVPHKAGVIEYISVLQGCMSVQVDGKWHELTAGQSLKFLADRPHSYRNRENIDAVVHCLIHYPAFGY